MFPTYYLICQQKEKHFKDWKAVQLHVVGHIFLMVNLYL